MSVLPCPRPKANAPPNVHGLLGGQGSHAAASAVWTDRWTSCGVTGTAVRTGTGSRWIVTPGSAGGGGDATVARGTEYATGAAYEIGADGAAAGSGAVVFLMALVFVFLILAAQYESWSLPLSILLGTPFAIFGAFLALYLARMFSPSYELNIFAQIALVMLIGMAAKNAILIVEFANLEFNKGLSLFDAAVKAANLRFRPILMTAFSFILGVLPLVVATGAGAEARVVMGVALLGGMALATMLGVFFYPMLFVFIGKIAGYEKKRELQKEQV